MTSILSILRSLPATWTTVKEKTTGVATPWTQDNCIDQFLLSPRIPLLDTALSAIVNSMGLLRKSIGSANQTTSSVYSNPKLYEAANAWKKDDVDFFVQWAQRTGGPVLELAAGTGRLAVPILQSGIEYVGLDYSPQFVAYGQRKIASFGDKGRMIVGDMRRFDLGRKFNMIFMGYNAFFHLMTDDDASQCLSCIQDHLQDGGKLIIDMFVPDPSYLHRGGKLHRILEFEHPDGGNCTVFEKNAYDSHTNVNHLWWYFFREGFKTPEIYDFSMHLYSPEHMRSLLEGAGFVIENIMGNYDGAQFSEKSTQQIYIASR